ncbi:Rrf2 family transcriptional regulator [soil metagenome]|jgi:Rrf2 family protein|nr:Rrf2 family transcriptional regulator [Acidobacteriota bacterium]
MAKSSQFSIAIHVLAMLAKNCDERMKSEYIAKSVNTNPVVIRRLLGNLYEANLVVSQTGVCGGTCLTQKPEDITLLDIYRAVSSSEVFALHPQMPNQNCFIGKNIQKVLEELQDKVDSAIEEKLLRITLADVLKSVEKEANSPK